MAMKVGGKGVTSDINITPFVDIVLVLLIIFMVITPMLSRTLDLSVPPKAEAETIQDVITKEQLIMTVRGPADSPRVFLNQEELVGAPESVKERIEALMVGRPPSEKVVFFQAENEVPYNYVIQVIDMIRGGNVEKIGLITDETLTEMPLGG